MASSDSSVSVAEENDDMFHTIIMAEEKSWSDGYKDGIEMGKKKAFEDGYLLGATKGLEIGREVGFYSGYADHILNVYKQNQSKARIVKVCEAICQLASQFVDIDPMDESLTDNLSKIQAKFKQLTSLLGVQTEYVTVVGNDVKGSTF